MLDTIAIEAEPQVLQWNENERKDFRRERRWERSGEAKRETW
jgi:hypothetical protein